MFLRFSEASPRSPSRGLLLGLGHVAAREQEGAQVQEALDGGEDGKGDELGLLGGADVRLGGEERREEAKARLFDADGWFSPQLLEQVGGVDTIFEVRDASPPPSASPTRCASSAWARASRTASSAAPGPAASRAGSAPIVPSPLAPSLPCPLSLSISHSSQQL